MGLGNLGKGGNPPHAPENKLQDPPRIEVSGLKEEEKKKQEDAQKAAADKEEKRVAEEKANLKEENKAVPGKGVESNEAKVAKLSSELNQITENEKESPLDGAFRNFKKLVKFYEEERNKVTSDTVRDVNILRENRGRALTELIRAGEILKKYIDEETRRR